MTASRSTPRLRILVAYVTRSGVTRVVARQIAAELRHRGHEVDLADLDGTRDPDHYDVVVLGSALRFRAHAEAVSTFITEHREALAARRCALFSVDHRAYYSPEADPGGHMARLFDAVGWRPQIAVAVAGKLDYREHTWPARQLMRVVSQRLGAPTDTVRDHTPIDWGRVSAFTDQITAAA